MRTEGIALDEDVDEDEEPVSCTEPGAPDDSVTAAEPRGKEVTYQYQTCEKGATYKRGGLKRI